MKRYVPGLLAIAAPFLIGLGCSFLFEADILPNRLLVGAYRIDFAGLISRAGLALSILTAAVVGLLWWAQAQVGRRQKEAHTKETALRRRFLRRLDHELKNPLTIIRLGIVNLQHSPNLTGEQVASLERVGMQAERLQRLVIDLRWLAGLEEHTLERRSVDLNAILEEVIDSTHDTPGYDKRQLDVQLQNVPWPMQPVWGDRDLLIVTFRNLLDNAFKYTASGDHVRVRAYEDGQTALVEIADTGPGIPEDEMPLIFEELYRGENARSVAGSGLGLAMVRRIVSLHRGTITVRRRVGQGTIMTVRLPLASDGM